MQSLESLITTTALGYLGETAGARSANGIWRTALSRYLGDGPELARLSLEALAYRAAYEHLGPGTPGGLSLNNVLLRWAYSVAGPGTPGGLSLEAVAALALSKGGGPQAWLADFMAGQSDGFWHDFQAASRLFQTTDETTPVDTFGQSIGRSNDRRTGPNSPRHATQTTASARPKWQATGAAFDGADDNLLTGYTPGAAGNFIVAKVTVPAIITSSQVIVGARTGAATRSYIGFRDNGSFGAGVGAQANDVIAGSVDRRGQTLVVGLTYDGSTVRLFEDASQTYVGGQSGAATTATPYRLGAFNDNGTANSFCAGSIASVISGRQFINLDTYLQIRAGLLA